MAAIYQSFTLIRPHIAAISALRTRSKRAAAERGPRHLRTDTAMKRFVAIAVCGVSLSACSSMPSLDFLPRSSPATTTIQFESLPPGAEAKASTGPATCRTPCAMPVAGDEFTVTFTLPGYQPQTVPVRIAPSSDPIDPDTNTVPPPRLAPNPVVVELVAAPPPAARKKPGKPPQKARPAPAPRPAPAATAPAPAPAPAAAWPPPPPPR